MTAQSANRLSWTRVARGMAALGLLAAPLAIAAASAGAEPADPIDTGLWEVKSSVEPMGADKTENRCLHHDQIFKFMHGQPNHIYKCTYSTETIADGKIALKGECRDKNGIGGHITGTGAYTRTTMHTTGHVTFLGIPFTARLDAHRIGDCPAGAK
jgi:hypothetical protein